MNPARDVWWSIESDETAEFRCNEIFLLIKDVALPQIKPLARTETLGHLEKPPR